MCEKKGASSWSLILRVVTQQPKAHAVAVMVSRPKEVWSDLAYTAFLTKGVIHGTASKGQTHYGRTFLGRDGTAHTKEPLIQGT